MNLIAVKKKWWNIYTNNAYKADWRACMKYRIGRILIAIGQHLREFGADLKKDVVWWHLPPHERGLKDTR